MGSIRPDFSSLLIHLETLNCVPVKILSDSPRSWVVLAEYSRRRKPVVIKVGSKNGSLQSELSALKKIRHTNIVTMMAHCELNSTLFLQLEKVTGRSLIDILVNEGRLSETESRPLFQQIFSAIHYLHSCSWIHRDLKPDNIIYDQATGVAKVIDFEFACQYSNDHFLEEKVGTSLYISPEVRNRKYIGPEVDIWCLGVTLYVTVVGIYPFCKQSPQQGERVETQSGQFSKTFGELELGSQLFFPTSTSLMFQNLIQQMLHRVPKRRIVSEHLLKHPWLTDKKDMRSLSKMWLKIDSILNGEKNQTSPTHSPPLNRRQGSGSHSSPTTQNQVAAR